MATFPKSTLPLRFGSLPELSNFAWPEESIVPGVASLDRRDPAGDYHKTVFVLHNAATSAHPYAGTT